MNKTIFITGTNSGIGKATVEYFAERQWNVCATVRDKAAHPLLFKQYKNVRLYALDVTNFEQVNHVVQQAISDCTTIDVLVNNAGYCLMGPTETTSMEQIKRQYETNVMGVFAVTKAFIPHFRKRETGIIINISSSSGQFNFPFIGAYGSSKWAIRGLTEGLGIELAPFGIQVKAIYPGTHATEIFTKLDHGAHPENPAYLAYKSYYTTFLAAQEAVPAVTKPSNIAQEIWRAATQHKKLHIISGGDAKFQWWMKKLLSQKQFQKMQIGLMTNTMNALQKRIAQLIFGKNVQTIETDIPSNLLGQDIL